MRLMNGPSDKSKTWVQSGMIAAKKLHTSFNIKTRINVVNKFLINLGVVPGQNSNPPLNSA